MEYFWFHVTFAPKARYSVKLGSVNLKEAKEKCIKSNLFKRVSSLYAWQYLSLDMLKLKLLL